MLALLSGAALPWRVAAQDAPPPIHHCVDAQGNAVFTDRSCAALQSTPMANTAPAPERHDFSEPPPMLCAGTAAALKQAVISAFASHDANRLAGFMLWGGDSHRAAIVEIRSLSRWVQQPLLGVSLTGASDSRPPSQENPAVAPDRIGARLSHVPSAPADPLPSPAGLVVSIAAPEGDSGAQQIPFGIVQQAGCVWLHNDD
jgi:hypothetical protein